MRAAADKARANPVALTSFLRLHLDVRAKIGKQYLDIGKWDRNRSGLDDAKLRGRPAYGGLDLSSVSDLTALTWLFPGEVGGYDVRWRFWLPEVALHVRLDMMHPAHRSQLRVELAGHLAGLTA